MFVCVGCRYIFVSVIGSTVCVCLDVRVCMYVVCVTVLLLLLCCLYICRFVCFCIGVMNFCAFKNGGFVDKWVMIVCVCRYCVSVYV